MSQIQIESLVCPRHRWARGPIAREIRYPPGFGGFSGFWLSHPKKRGAGRTKTRKGGAVLTTAAPGEEEKERFVVRVTTESKG